MDSNEYQRIALFTDPADDYAPLIESFTRRVCNQRGLRLLNAALGMAGESAEFSERIKKWAFQGHDLDRAKLIEELGDVRWYMSLAATALELLLTEVDEGNIAKLRSRYPEGVFSVDRSVNRQAAP